MWSYLIYIYYTILGLLKKNNEAFDFKSNPKNKDLYYKLNGLTNKFNEKSNLQDIINFLEEESKFILTNKNNLEVSIGDIKNNTYVLHLLSEFKNLQEKKVN